MKMKNFLLKITGIKTKIEEIIAKLESEKDKLPEVLAAYNLLKGLIK